MNSVANCTLMSLNIGHTPQRTKGVMLFLFSLVATACGLAWSSILTDKESGVQRSLLAGGSAVSTVLLAMLLLYLMYIINTKMSHTKFVGEVNMHTSYQNAHIGFNPWILLLFIITLISTVIFLFAYINHRTDNIDTANTAAKINTGIFTAIIGGWLLYYIYMGITIRTYKLFDVVYELDKKDVNMVKLERAWNETLNTAGHTTFNRLKKLLD